MKITVVIGCLLAAAFIGAAVAEDVQAPAQDLEVAGTDGGMKEVGDDGSVLTSEVVAAAHRNHGDGHSHHVDHGHHHPHGDRRHHHHHGGHGHHHPHDKHHGDHHHRGYRSHHHSHGDRSHHHSHGDRSHHHSHGDRSSHQHHHKHHSSSGSHEHERRKHRVCSVQSDYWLPEINEKRVCRNTANGNTGDCQNCCVAAYMQDHEGEKGEGVVGFISTNPKNAKQRQCVCCSPHKRGCNRLTHLTKQQLATYSRLFDTDPYAGNATEIGHVEFERTRNGYEVTCQCRKKSGDQCWLEFADGFESGFLKKESIAINTLVDSRGGFAKLTSAEITCENGLNYINGIKITHFTCFTWTVKK